MINDTGYALYGAVPDPLTLTGTRITGASTLVKAMQWRAHRHAVQSESDVELWYYRDSAWSLMPVQPNFTATDHPTINKAWKQPTTLSFSLQDTPTQQLQPTNMNSSYNYNGSAIYDPLLDGARKVVLRAGTYCYGNLISGKTPVSSLALSGGLVTYLTDGLFGDVTSSNANYARWAPASVTPFTITVDTGSVQKMANCVFRFATKSGTCTLPATVQVSVSNDNFSTTLNSWPTKPVGGSVGDWQDDLTGRNIELYRCDMECSARYIRLTITPTGSQTIWMDEIALYGGVTSTLTGANVFCGYLGNKIAPATATATVSITATSVEKKLQDNNECPLTNQYTNQESGDIIRNMLTSGAYWKGTGGSYDQAFGTSEVGWSAGANVTAFLYPAWQGQANNLYGYCQDLTNAIGYSLYGDGSGVLQLQQPVYRQNLPDRIFVNDTDGDHDAWSNNRVMDDTYLRNVIEVNSADPNSGGAQTVRFHPSSVSRYGHRRMKITDPIAADQTTREKIGDYVLRDYAYRNSKLVNTIRPDSDTKIKKVYGIRAPFRPCMYPNNSSASSALTLQELWCVNTIEEHITAGDWYAHCSYVPYKSFGPASPTGLTATPTGTGHITIAFTASTDSDVTDYNIYVSTGPDSFPLTPTTHTSGATSISLAGYTGGVQYWFYVTAVGYHGVESLPSSVVTCITDGGAGGTGDNANWAITDLAAYFNQSSAPTNTDAYYEYEVLLTWTSPPVGANAFQQANYGTKQFEVRLNPVTAPSNPTLQSSWLYQDEWHGDRIPPGTEWDGTTVGPLNWYARFKSASNLSGVKIYFRIWTWEVTNGRNSNSHYSNVVYATIP